jgi:hypothetical protein
MSDFVIVVYTGLLVYWFSRTLLLLKGSQEEIDETLACEVWWGLVVLRTIFGEPTQSAG